MSTQPILRYSLDVSVTHAERVIRELHCYAQEQSFLHVGKIFRAQKDECAILSEDDPMAYLKIQARGIALFQGKVITFTPDRFIGFAAQLPNKRLMSIGLTKQPDILNMEDGQIRNPWVGRMHWHSSAETMDGRYSSGPDCCKESHRVAIDLLRQAEALMALVSVDDPTGYWGSQKAVDLPFCDKGVLAT